jgi:2-phosphosulfolactate phosphatase
MVYLGAEQIVLLAEPEEVLALKAGEGYLAVGEVHGRPVPGFDLGNSPSQIVAAGQELFAGRRIAQRTSAGVTGAVAAARAAQAVILGSYLTAGATARYLQSLTPPPEAISLIAMGMAGHQPAPEDEACADYLEHLLIGRAYDHVATLHQVVTHESTQKFLHSDQDHYPPEDPVYCLQRDLFDFVLVATIEEAGRLVARRVDIGRGGGR